MRRSSSSVISQEGESTSDLKVPGRNKPAWGKAPVKKEAASYLIVPKGRNMSAGGKAPGKEAKLFFREPLKTSNFFVGFQVKMLIYQSKLRFSLVHPPRTSLFLEVPFNEICRK